MFYFNNFLLAFCSIQHLTLSKDTRKTEKRVQGAASFCECEYFFQQTKNDINNHPNISSSFQKSLHNKSSRTSTDMGQYDDLDKHQSFFCDQSTTEQYYWYQTEETYLNNIHNPYSFISSDEPNGTICFNNGITENSDDFGLKAENTPFQFYISEETVIYEQNDHESCFVQTNPIESNTFAYHQPQTGMNIFVPQMPVVTNDFADPWYQSGINDYVDHQMQNTTNVFVPQNLDGANNFAYMQQEPRNDSVGAQFQIYTNAMINPQIETHVFVNQTRMNESNTSKEKLNSLSKSNLTLLEQIKNEKCLIGNDILDFTVLEKYFSTSYNKISKLVVNIDQQILLHLSKENIKERFIYSIFFDDLNYMKSEFLFLIYVLPEIEVITSLYNQIIQKNYNADIFNDNLQEYKGAMKTLIICYRNILKTILENNKFYNFRTTNKINEYILKRMKTRIDIFRKYNLKILGSCFKDCDSLRFYDNLVRTDSKGKDISKYDSNVSIFFVVFLNQDWISKLSVGQLILKSIYFCKEIRCFNHAFKATGQVYDLFYNLNIFANIINQNYFMNLKQYNIEKYDENNIGNINRKPFIKVKKEIGGSIKEDEVPLLDYLLEKYKKYCDNLFFLYTGANFN